MLNAHLTGRPGRRRLVVVTAATLGIVLVTAACSSSKKSTPSSAATGGGTTSSAGSAASAGSTGKQVGVALILKTLTNPYFVSMATDAKTAAAKDNVKLTVAAGKQDGDTQTQISAIDDAISRGDKGILITTNGDAVNSELNKAKKAGIFVIALDTAPNPPSTADITYATDNEAAGKLDGQYAAKQLGGKPAVIAMLDLFNNQVVSVDIQRDHGFLEGLGINPGSTTQNGKEAASGKYTRRRRRQLHDRLPPAHPGCDRRRPDGHGELPVQEPEDQRGLRHQRAGGRGCVQRAQGPGQDQWRVDLRHRRKLRRPEVPVHRRVHRGRGAVPGQDGQPRCRLDRQAGSWRSEADHLGWTVVLQHRHAAGHRQAAGGRHQRDLGHRGAKACWGS